MDTYQAARYFGTKTPMGWEFAAGRLVATEPVWSWLIVGTARRISRGPNPRPICGARFRGESSGTRTTVPELGSRKYVKNPHHTGTANADTPV